MSAGHEKNRVQQQAGIEDDYLAEPLSIEGYVVFRVRPLLEMYEKHGRKLSSRLQSMEIAGIVINSMGAVLASSFIDCQEWVSLTVAIVMLLTNIIEFHQLKGQVVAVNLTLGELTNLMGVKAIEMIDAAKTPVIT